MAFRFSPTPSQTAMEWPGLSLGRSRNTVTATRSRTPVYDKTVDASPGKLERLLSTAADLAEATRAAGRPVYQEEVIIHGVRVRCLTNSRHLIEFWRLNWFHPEEWETLTGRPAPREPGVRVYALAGLNGEGGEPAAYYSRRENTVVFFNTSYYGQLKSWVLGAVGRLLADTEGVHSIHGAAVKHGDRGVLFIAPTGTGKSTSSYGLMADALAAFGSEGARFHSDDWVYVRYFFPTGQGGLVAPREIRDRAGRQLARGFRCQTWLRERGLTRGATGASGTRGRPRRRAGGKPAREEASLRDVTILGVTPSGASVRATAADLDPDRPPVALAYISEKTFYLRTNLVESYPAAAGPMTETLLENVPDEVDPEDWAPLAPQGDRARTPAGGSEAAAGDGRVTALDLARLAAFDNARAMLAPASIFGPSAVYTNPTEPLRLTHVFLLKREFGDTTVLRSLDLADFCGRLLLGKTPEGKAEVAYNAYRAVDDRAEAAYIGALAATGNGQPPTPAGVFRRHLRVLASSRPPLEAPDSLVEEFELFQTLHASVSAYLVNTILQSAPGISSRAEAVHATLRLFVTAMSRAADGKARVTLKSWR